MKQHSKVYFPGLNALRFFAASVVVFGHIEQIKQFRHMPAYRATVLEVAPSLAVTFFFVLSGFLITFLLLKEREVHGVIDIKKFYIRRILRVWPLYYLIVFLVFIVLPSIPAFYIPGLSDEIHHDLPYNLVLYMALLPNVAQLFNMLAVYGNQLWSIGVEEQFYLFWPWLLRKRQPNYQMFLLIIILFIFSRNSFAFLSSHLHNPQLAGICGMFNALILATRIDCMAIGGLTALLIYKKQAWLINFLVNRKIEVLTLAAIIYFTYSGVYIPYIHHDFFAVIFSLFIINVSCNPKSIFCLEGRVWTGLGNISYGIYMYHLVAIGIMLAIFRAFQITNFSLLQNALLHASSLLLTIAIAQLSYRFFEMPFLVIKDRMARIKSGSITGAG